MYRKVFSSSVKLNKQSIRSADHSINNTPAAFLGGYVDIALKKVKKYDKIIKKHQPFWNFPHYIDENVLKMKGMESNG